MNLIGSPPLPIDARHAGNISRNFRRECCPSAPRLSIRDASCALVYTSVMMVYGRWRRGPRGGRVGHAVNRRTQPRQNLRRNNRGQESPVACETMRVKLNYLVPCVPPGRATAAGSRRKIRRPFMKFYYRVESPVFDAEIRFGVYRVSKGGGERIYICICR